MTKGKLKEVAYILLCGTLGGITAHILWYGMTETLVIIVNAMFFYIEKCISNTFFIKYHKIPPESRC